MKGYVENSVVILGDSIKIFDLTNTLERWKELFTEYNSVEIIEKSDNEILFMLTTNNGKSWTSKRYINKEKMTVNAVRINPLFPFKEMNIFWKYEQLPQNVGVIMTWIQEFEVDPLCQHDTYDMESYLNRATREQMRAVKANVERILYE